MSEVRTSGLGDGAANAAAPDGAGVRTEPSGERAFKQRVQWSKERREAFLDHLAATCHVARSAEAAGVDVSAAYLLRRRDPTFAAGWGDALRAGYEALEMKLVAHAMSGGGARTVDEGGMDVELAMKLLSTHRNALLGRTFKSRPLHVADRDETTNAILKKLKIVEARHRRAAAGGAATALLPAPGAEHAVEKATA